MNDDTLTYVVKPDDHYIFLREVLKSQMEISHSLLTKLKAQHQIQVNGQIALTNYRLKAGDLVTVNLTLTEKNYIEPVAMPLDIIYEDADFLIVNKPPGLAVHPGKDRSITTLANAVTHYWCQQGIYSLFRPINRLDKQTSGLVLIGKSQYAHQAVFRQQKEGILKRSYQALVEGMVHEDKGCIDLPIAHIDPQNSNKRSVDPGGKPAKTYFTVIQRFQGFSLLSLNLETGRTHQIRVHLSHLGHPVCGDILYGNPSPLITRQALHAGQLSLNDPRTGAARLYQAAMPEDMLKLLAALKPLGEQV